MDTSSAVSWCCDHQVTKKQKKRKTKPYPDHNTTPNQQCLSRHQETHPLFLPLRGASTVLCCTRLCSCGTERVVKYCTLKATPKKGDGMGWGCSYSNNVKSFLAENACVFNYCSRQFLVHVCYRPHVQYFYFLSMKASNVYARILNTLS